MDINYLLMLQGMREATNGLLDSFLSYITTYGEELITMMIAAAIYWCVDKSQGIYTMMTWGLGRLFNGFLKVTACIYRPWIRDSRIVPVDGAMTTATGYSFPSGHTTNATAVFGSIAMNKKITRCIRICMILIVVLVGFSRNYLGVHTPQDVLVGCGSTILLLFFTRWLLEMADKTPNLDVIILSVGIVLGILVMVYASVKGYPMDYDASGNLIVDPDKMAIDTYKGCGFFVSVIVSWFIDRRWLHYEVKGKPIERLSYYVAGILGFWALVYIIIPLFPQNIIGSFMDRFVRLIYVMLVVPFLINACEKRKQK